LLLRGAVRRLTYSARLPDEGGRVKKKTAGAVSTSLADPADAA